ncbi:MAG TPA: ABC transporter substrate-binding protein [Stellaceae bacterium]|nr:ABC transporter substrate-binding protein [Stellaceae bacterium]
MKRDAMRQRKTALIAAVLTALMVGAGPACADSIVVTDYGAAPGGFVYAVALAKGYFKEEGTNITGVISSQGGGTSVRNMIAGGAIYGEINPAAVMSAVQQGAKLKIISDNVLLVSDLVWAVKPDSPIKTLADLKGRKIGYTNPKSSTEGLTLGLLKYAKLQPSDVEMVKTGGFGEGVAALDLGIIDVAPIVEPIWARLGSKYRVLALGKDVLPTLANTVGVTTEAAAEKQGDMLRRIIRARRRAVQFLYAHPDEAGDIVAEAYKIEPDVARRAVHDLIGDGVGDVPYFGEGNFHPDSLKRMLDLQIQIGAVQAPADISGIIDEQFLPEDLKSK